MKIMRLSVVMLLLCTLLLAGCGQASNPPQVPAGIGSVPASLPGGPFILTWEAPEDWGAGADPCYRVEFFDGEEWHYLNTVTETKYTYELPLDVNSADNRFSVRAETSLGHSDWLTSNSFDVINPGLDQEFLLIEPGDQELAAEEGVFTLVAQVSEGLDTILWFADVSWLTLPAESGPDEEIQVQVDENDSETERQGVITASVGDLATTITVTQAADEIDASISVTPRSINIDLPWENSFDASVNVVGAGASTVAWTSNVNWLSLPSSGIAVSVNVAENETNNSRTGRITVTAGDDLRATLTVTQVGRRAPDLVSDLDISWKESLGKYTISWSVPDRWGTGESRQYRVEFYDGDSWTLVDETTETELSFEIPSYVDLEAAMVRVRAETSHGNSGYSESDPFDEEEGNDQGENEYLGDEPVFSDDELTLTPKHVFYDDGILVLIAWITNGFDSAVADIESVSVRVSNEESEIARSEFGNFEEIVFSPGEAVEWRFEFADLGDEVDLRAGVTAEFLDPIDE